MANIFIDQSVDYRDPVIFETAGRYSTGAAVAILRSLEGRPDCRIENRGWETSGYGDLIEVGIPVRIGNVEFTVMCSYEHIFIERVAGNKMKFWQICETIREMDIDEAT